MILTVTLNPAIDLTMEVDRLRHNRTNRASKVTHVAGGKGVNISSLLSRFGFKTEALVVLGGVTGQQYLELTAGWPFPLRVVPVQGSTRVNTVISDIARRQHTKVDQPGPKLTRAEIQLLKTTLDHRLAGCDLVQISGGVPPYFPVQDFVQLLRMTRHRGVRVCLDTRGEALAAALLEKTFLVKPNLGELEEACGKRLKSRQALCEQASRLFTTRTENLVVTLGKKGAYWFSREGAWFAAAPEVSREPTLAAGDSTMAGILMALYQGEGKAEALRWGTALGCATALAQGTRMATRKEFQRLLRQVYVETL